ncbi:MAG: branched-chain amino acid ABC transporter permease [Phycisphaerales bacterium]
MADFLQTLITAVAVGSLYALIALGYTMVYGILKFINFAHSDIVVLGAWISYTLAGKLLAGQAPGEPIAWWVGGVILVAAMAGCALVGFTVERLAYKPLRRAPRLNVLITAIGVSLLLQNTGQLRWVFGTQPASMPALLPDVTLATVAGVKLSLIDVVITATAVVLMTLLQVLVFRTKIGAAMRAVSFNTDHAALMGIPVNRVISITFVIGTALAAAAGFLIAMKYPGLNPPAHEIWVLLGLKAFVAAVVGGIGNIRGAVLGGFLIATLEQFGAFYISSSFKDVYVFALLIVVLLVKPTGLLGTPVREKV